jgi:hypothetical protein
VPGLASAMPSANTVKGGSLSITLTATTLGRVVSHLADVLVVRAAPSIGSTGFEPAASGLTGLGHAQGCAFPPILAKELSRISLDLVGLRRLVQTSHRVHNRVHT